MPTMPNIVGRDLQDATAMLEAAGVIDLAQIGYFGTWPITVDWLTDTEVEPNIVLSQHPSAGGDITGYTEFFDVGLSASLNSALLGGLGHGYGSTCALTADLTGWGLVATSIDVTAPAFAFAASAPAPSGYGFLAKPATDGPLVPDQYYSVYVSVATSLLIGVNGCDVVADIYLRYWRYDSDTQTFEQMAQLEAASVSLEGGGYSDVTDWSVIDSATLYFDADDWLFVDVVANITSNVPDGTLSPAILLGPEPGSGMLNVILGRAGPNIVGVNPSIDLTVSNLPVSVIYP